MTEPGALRVGLLLPPAWIEVDPEVLTDPELMGVLGIAVATFPVDRAFELDDVICAAVLSELIPDDDDRPIGAVVASLVAVLAPPSPPDQVFPLARREPFGEPIDGSQPWLHVIVHRAAFPEINCDLLMQFSTPNLPLLPDLEVLFESIAATATCEAAPS